MNRKELIDALVTKTGSAKADADRNHHRHSEKG